MSRGVVGQDVSIGDWAEFHVNIAELDDLIETHGVGAELRRAVECPCVRLESLAARLGCPHCHGLQWVYPEDMREYIVVLLTSRRPTERVTQAGRTVTGQLQALFPSGILPARGDQIFPAGERHVVQQFVHRQVSQVSGRKLRDEATVWDQVAPAQRPSYGRLLYEDATIESVHWIVPYVGAADERLVSGRLGHEFHMQGREVIWHGEHGPRPGDAFSVRYQAPAAYMLYTGVPVYRAEAGAPYPYRADVDRLDKYAEEDLR